MADVHDKLTRSYNMSQIRSKNTRPEMIVRKFLFSKGFRYRIHDKKLPGKPDIVLPKHRTVIFVHGCFWHGHEGCKYFSIPKSNADWWKGKIQRNMELDKKYLLKLEHEGWKVLSIFECELKPKTKEKTLLKTVKYLYKNGNPAN